MNDLSPRDRALVGLGAALGSNCIPCIEHHVPAARSAGLTDDEILAALNLADTIRQVPARRVLARATELVSAPASETATASSCSTLDKKPPVEQTLDAMTSTMQRMMASCAPAAPAAASGCGPGATQKAAGGCC